MVSGFSRMLAAMMIPTRQTVDLLSGMWTFLNLLGGVPKELVWDSETGIGRRNKLTEPAKAFAGTLGTASIRLLSAVPAHALNVDLWAFESRNATTPAGPEPPLQNRISVNCLTKMRHLRRTIYCAVREP